MSSRPRPKPGKLFELAAAQTRTGRLDRASDLCRQVLALEPRHADALHLLGTLFMRTGEFESALPLLSRAISESPSSPALHSNLGETLRRLGQLDPAIASFERALFLRPEFPEAAFNLGLSLHARGRFADAIAYYERALDAFPDLLAARQHLTSALLQHGEVTRALTSCERWLASNPDAPDLLVIKGAVLRKLDRFDEASQLLHRAVSLAPHRPEAHRELGGLLKDQGRPEDAAHCFRRVTALDPTDPRSHGDLLFLLPFFETDADAIAAEAREWAKRHARTAHPRHSQDNDGRLERRLRIGYVSPDFRDHCQALFMLPVLRHHDHGDFEIFCYSSTSKPDAVTALLRECADTWRDVGDRTDGELIEQIRSDGIDVLVDLTMHMAANRLAVFGAKPAPVQVSWLAYPGTTGLSAIDYRLSDAILDPKDSARPYSEETWLLPDTFWCYDAGTSPPEVSDLPATSRGHVTFGCLNNLCKVNAPLLETVAELLRATPGSRLLLLALPGEPRRRIENVFSAAGVDPGRIEFVGYQTRASYLETYRRIDVALDTVPYNGHTTSLDSFFMGVPVVTWVGPTVVGRAGLSYSTHLGLPELVATNRDEYVRIATDLAADLPRLARLRSELRSRLQASPLMDAPRFTRNLEAAYRSMWRTWCAGRAPTDSTDLTECT